MLMKGKLAEMIVLVDPKLYCKYVIYDTKGTPILYVKMNKALYGLLQSALLWYKKLTYVLKTFGFKINPYDPCVANKMVEGSPMTIMWHMDDLKVSHKDPFQITMYAIYHTKFFGKNIMVKHGKVNDFLGIDWDYSKKGVVKVSMIKYISNIIKEFPETIIGSAPLPVADHLFQVQDEDDPKYRLHF